MFRGRRKPLARRARRAHRAYRTAGARRVATVAISCVLTLAMGAGYIAADIADVAPGLLTLRQVAPRAVPATLTAKGVGEPALVADLGHPRAVDAAKAQALVDRMAATEGIGSLSAAIGDATGNIVSSHDADKALEPASTMKTLTALAAASTLDMASTLDTEVHLRQGESADTLVLKGNGDMLLSAGASDSDHTNGRAGLATLAERTAAALRQRGIGTVHLEYDDGLFGEERYPARMDEINADHIYYTGVSSMAVDGGRQWTGANRAPADPDDAPGYPLLSQSTAQDAAATFARLLADQGITMSGDIATGTAPAGSPLASVSSATLGEIMAYMLRHSDNTLAEEFGRLTALAMGKDNSPTGATEAVREELRTLGIDTTGLVMSDCSGLSPGSVLSVRTLVGVQSRNIEAGGAAAPAEGLSVAGLVGTAGKRIGGDSAGLVRAKTGSLSNVASMSGNVSRIGGGVLTFAVIVNDPEDYGAAREAIDAFVGQLAEL